MANKVTFDYSLTENVISADEIKSMEKITNDAKELLLSKEGAGSDFLGWIDLPIDYDKEEFARIKASAEKIRKDSEVLVVIGIGGSYLGARAAIEFIKSQNYNLLRHGAPEIYFAGNTISSASINELVEIIGDRDFSVNVISKSGTTTEPAVAFRIFREMLESKYGAEEAAKRIYATTDKARGTLKALADAEGYETFVVPDDVGGRYSVLTAVGLLPIAVAGIDITQKQAEHLYDTGKFFLFRRRFAKFNIFPNVFSVVSAVDDALAYVNRKRFGFVINDYWSRVFLE